MGARERLQRCRKELEGLRGSGGVRGKDLIGIAKRMGFQKKNRGKEPTWEHDNLDILPLTVPGHSGDLAKPTARSIIDRLLADLDVLEGVTGEEDDDV